MHGYVTRNTTSLLARESRHAVLIELNGLGARYGFNDADLHARLLDFGFHPMRYEPFARRLVALEGHQDTRQHALRSPIPGAGAAAAGSTGGAGAG